MSYDKKVLIEGVAPTHGGYGLAVSGNYLYWAAGVIGRVNLNGGELNEEFIKPASPRLRRRGRAQRRTPAAATGAPCAGQPDAEPDRQTHRPEVQERLPAKVGQGQGEVREEAQETQAPQIGLTASA